MISATASRLSSIAMRIPSRSDSSRKSEMPSIFFSWTKAAICSMSRTLLTMKGISLMMICAFAVAIGLHNRFFAVDESGSWKIRPGNMFHQLFDGDSRIVDHCDQPIDDFADIVRRNVGCHSNRDSRCAVDQEIRNAR